MADTQDKHDEDVFEEGEPKEARTVHRMRANSTIMQVNKILVANRGEIRKWCSPKLPGIRSLIEDSSPASKGD